MAQMEKFLMELRERTAMPILVGREIALNRSGRVWKGLCPFHDESTPSFYAYDHGFHCFGCGAHGDAIDFVMRTRAITLDQAIVGLAAAANLGLPDD
jgi:DNA primase